MRTSFIAALAIAASALVGLGLSNAVQTAIIERDQEVRIQALEKDLGTVTEILGILTDRALGTAPQPQTAPHGLVIPLPGGGTAFVNPDQIEGRDSHGDL